MKVLDLMTSDVACCGLDVDLNRAAQLMLENDCGVLPVVDAERRVVGIVTDRDVCMGGHMSGRPLHELQVANSMTADVATCAPEDSIERALSRMAERQVRRLPVVDTDGQLRGLLSMNDLFRAALHETGPTAHRTLAAELVETLASICEPHHGAAALQPVPPVPPASPEPAPEPAPEATAKAATARAKAGNGAKTRAKASAGAAKKKTTRKKTTRR